MKLFLVFLLCLRWKLAEMFWQPAGVTMSGMASVWEQLGVLDTEEIIMAKFDTLVADLNTEPDWLREFRVENGKQLRMMRFHHAELATAEWPLVTVR